MASTTKPQAFEIRWNDGDPSVYQNDQLFDGALEVPRDTELRFVFYVVPHPPGHPGLLRFVQPLKMAWAPDRPHGVHARLDDPFQMTIVANNADSPLADRQASFQVYVTDDGHRELSVSLQTAGADGGMSGVDPTLILKGLEGPPPTPGGPRR